MIIEICDWAKFNPRTDRANHSWFRFENKFFNKTFSWSINDQRVMIYACCIASQESRAQIDLDIDLACALLKLKRAEFLKSLNNLRERKIITVKIGRHEAVTEPPLLLTTNERTNETNETYIPAVTDGQIIDGFDFEYLYGKYPRKEGKAKGLKTCKVQIKTSKEYSDLENAIDRYTSHCRKNLTEAKFIKHFSTFMTSWRDWLDETTGTVEMPKTSDEIPDWRKQVLAEEQAEREKAERDAKVKTA